MYSLLNFQTEITRLATPYPSNCSTFWNESIYEQSESVAYTMAVRKYYFMPSVVFQILIATIRKPHLLACLCGRDI
jgi:hypothetical protein